MFAASHSTGVRTALNESDADPSRSRNPPRFRPEGLSRFRWRGLTPQWPRSLRLGSASGSNVAPRTRARKPSSQSIAQFPANTPRRVRPKRARLRVRSRLSVLPQWIHGQRRRLAATVPRTAAGGRTRAAASATVSASPLHHQKWPARGVIGRPATSIRGPVAPARRRSRIANPTRFRLPLSRTLVTPA